MTGHDAHFMRSFVLPAILAAQLIALGCTTTHRPAPVVERAAPPVQPALTPAPAPAPKPVSREPDPRPESYTVKKGDTLYLIALDFGLDYRELAEWNNLDNPNVIRVGQQLRLHPPAATVVASPLRTPARVEGRPVTADVPQPVMEIEGVKSQPVAVKVPYSDHIYTQMSGVQTRPVPVVVVKVEPRAEEKPAVGADDYDRVDWGWPAGGKVVSSFNESSSLKGIGITGKSGQAVTASASGKVLYSGDGIRGYGKLVIIKHNKEYLSVYAHNSQVLVKEGQNVIKGQKIAEMGNSDADQVKLHFEIRRFGKPVDPVRMLPPERPA